MWSRRSGIGAGLAAALAAALLWAGAAAADDAPAEAEEWPLNVIILHTSQGEGGVEPRAQKYDDALGRSIRYKSLRVLGEERVKLHADEVGTIPLPNGRSLRVQPVHKGKQGLLMGIDVEGSVKLDARARRGHRVVVDGGPYEDGNLAVSIEPDYPADDD